ncbi:hypothetical protein EKK58_09960 [Candidatus Dependentiae bacterium]|nr:MAG: hypothetical protein EKK58_09960 [Candidatus Dependentiae bacterium]
MDILFVCKVVSVVGFLVLFVTLLSDYYSSNKIKVETKIYSTLLTLVLIALISLCVIVYNKEAKFGSTLEFKEGQTVNLYSTQYK